MRPFLCFVFSALSGLFLLAQGPKLPSLRTTVSDPGFSAYYFFSPVKLSPSGNSLPINILLDPNGDYLYYNKFSKGPFAGSFRIQPNKKISYYFNEKFYFMDSTFTIVDSVACKNGILHDPHDLLVLDNGHYVLLGYEYVKMDLSAFNFFSKNNSPGGKEAKVKCDVIQELDADKNVVFEWHGKDHYKFDDVDPVFLSNPNDVDWMHFNAVEYDQDGNILVSVRNFNEITKIRKSDGKILWRLGGKRNQFTFSNDILMFKGQHDIRARSKNTISLFDNGNADFPVHPEGAKEYVLDEQGMTATLSWKHINNAAAYSSGYGNVQTLKHNNRLINYGRSEQANTIFNVVTPEGKKLFELISPDTLRNYRAFAYEELPWKLTRPVISCYKKNGEIFLDAGKGYKQYLWSDGQQGQIIRIKKPGAYTVHADLKQGGTLVSSPLLIQDLSDPSIQNRK